MKKWLLFLIVLVVLVLSACSNSDELSGKTFDVSVGMSSPDDPVKYGTLMTLEFSDGKVINNSLHGEEGTYELQDDKLVMQFKNENESLEIEFTLNTSDKAFSEYSAEISNSDFQMEDSSQVSKYKGFYQKLWERHFEFIER